MDISEAQLAEVLVGIIKAQAAALQAVFDINVIGLKVVPALQAAGGIPGQSVSLSNWPARALLSAVTGNQINRQMLQDLLQRAVE